MYKTLVVVVQSLSPIWLFATPWTVACQASLTSTTSWSLLKFMSIELVILFNHLILCHPLLLLSSIFPRIRVFSNESALRIRGQNFVASASASLLPMNILSWFLLQLTGLISLPSKGLSRVFSSTTIQKHQFFSTKLYGPVLISIHDYLKNHSFDCMDVCWHSDISAF